MSSLYRGESVFSTQRIPRLGKYTGNPCPESLRNERDIRDIRDIRGSRGIRDITGRPENNLKQQSTPFQQKKSVRVKPWPETQERVCSLHKGESVPLLSLEEADCLYRE